MSSYSATFFLDGTSHFRGSTSVHPSFYVEPDGKHRPGWITLQIDSDLSIDDQLKVAERLASAAIEWRDGLAEQVDRERTAASELEAARAEIARLKAEAGEES